MMGVLVLWQGMFVQCPDDTASLDGESDDEGFYDEISEGSDDRARNPGHWRAVLMAVGRGSAPTDSETINSLRGLHGAELSGVTHEPA